VTPAVLINSAARPAKKRLETKTTEEETERTVEPRDIKQKKRSGPRDKENGPKRKGNMRRTPTRCEDRDRHNGENHSDERQLAQHERGWNSRAHERSQRFSGTYIDGSIGESRIVDEHVDGAGALASAGGAHQILEIGGIGDVGGERQRPDRHGADRSDRVSSEPRKMGDDLAQGAGGRRTTGRSAAKSRVARSRRRAARGRPESPTNPYVSFPMAFAVYR